MDSGAQTKLPVPRNAARFLSAVALPMTEVRSSRIVMAELDPAIHLFAKVMDCRVIGVQARRSPNGYARQ